MDVVALFDAWFRWSIGKPINVDGAYGNQCVDVSTAWSEFVFPGVRWWNSIGYGNAKDLYRGASLAYFEKIPYTVGVVPQKGDIFVKDGTEPTGANPEGHTGVVISATASKMHVIQQNGYNPSGVAYEGDLSYNKIIGFLRPRGASMPGDRYDTIPGRADIAAHYAKRMNREATEAELANVDRKDWSEILDDNVTELQKRLTAAQNSTKEYTKAGVIAYLQANTN